MRIFIGAVLLVIVVGTISVRHVNGLEEACIKAGGKLILTRMDRYCIRADAIVEIEK